MTLIFDAHIHAKNNEDGGFLIGLEGNPHYEGILSNSEVLALHDPANMYFAFYYVLNNEVHNKMSHPLLKYHPRREKYSVESVSLSIKKNAPKAVIIDTLNEPYWTAYDYWKIARDNQDIAIVLAHSGGYLINDFIKICHLQKNVWLDFSATQSDIGKLGDTTKGLGYVIEAINYSLNSPFKNRVLLSSDYPFFDQKDVFEYYSSYHDLLNGNFKEFVDRFII